VTYTGPGTQYISKGLSNPMIIPLKSLENTLVWSLLGKFRTWVAQRISNEEYDDPQISFDNNETSFLILGIISLQFSLVPQSKSVDQERFSS